MAATKKEAIRKALLDGEVLTPMVAFNKYRSMSLSQRVGELIDEGLPIKSEKVQGQPYHRYWIERAPEQLELVV